MKIRTYLVALAALAFGSTARADEGMWLLQLMKQQNSIELMKKQGLKLEADDLYNPNGVSLKDAVGIFGGGCTGEIISPEGLILTNHHCGYASIQQHSSVEHDYLTDGFWAKNRGEELPTPGLKFQFVDRIEDITDIVNQKIAAGEVTEVNALTRPFLNKLAKELFEKSDLKGKVVLLDFTIYQSAASAPHNFLLNDLYTKYKDQGLVIYQVSLDADEHFWKTTADNLPWISVRDANGIYSNVAAMYNVKEVPSLFLINRNSELSARGETIKDLDAAVKALL